ncbi:MAG: hypothetical protein Q8P81_02080 [Nanoarchaeota archaeon]|nr:hypothetical protein [Nanoarchaeota archaeon]
MTGSDIRVGSLVSEQNGWIGVIIQVGKILEEETIEKYANYYKLPKSNFSSMKSFKVKWVKKNEIYEYFSGYPIHRWELLSSGC